MDIGDIAKSCLFDPGDSRILTGMEARVEAHDGHNNMVRLTGAGIDAEDAVRIARDAVWIYDRNQKPRGARDGAIGMTGREVYDTLSRTPVYDPDLEAFLSYRPYTTEALADRMVRSVGAVGRGVRQLTQHGFMDKRRDGRHFLIRLMIPNIALNELGQWWASTDCEPGTFAYEFDRPMGETLLQMYPAN